MRQRVVRERKDFKSLESSVPFKNLGLNGEKKISATTKAFIFEVAPIFRTIRSRENKSAIILVN